MYQLIGEGIRSKVYKCKGESGGEESICKIHGNSKNSKSELLNEFEIASQLNINGVRKAIKSGIYENKTALYYKYFDGISLKKLISERSISPIDFFAIGLNIIRTLKLIHDSGVTHLRINSNNILVNPSTLETLIIDFSLATRSTESNEPNFNDWGDELAYMAPEQTKHFNKTVDHRTDLYSFGIVLYELWSGETPFSETETSDIIHSHLVKVPPPVTAIIPETPVFISDIIERLLEKNPDSRYQTANGLELDLNECLQLWNTGEINPKFKAGKLDRPDRLPLSQDFYGRKKELDLLKSSFEKVRDAGKEAFFISGNTGVGKTALIQEFTRFVEMKNGISLYGSFGKLSPDVPYRAVIDAFEGLATNILSQSETKLKEWKEILNFAVDDIGQLLIDLVPIYHWIIGDQKPIPNLSAGQMESRVNYLFYRLLKYIANPAQPVVFVIDNFHKVDLASLKTFKTLLEENDIEHVIFIFNYRNSGNDQDANFNEKLDELISISPAKTEISLENLEAEDVLNFFNDSFFGSNLEELSNITYKKTLGNPFFLIKFLHSLYEEKILFFNSALQQWEYDKEKAEAVQLAKNVVDYMTEKVKKLDIAELTVLKQAACFGNIFRLEDLAGLANLPSGEMNNMIASFQEQDIIVKLNEKYRFAHERIQEAAFELLNPDEKSEWHYKIFELLQNQINPDINTDLFNASNYLAIGFNQIPKDNYFDKVKVFYEASKRAKKTASFELSFKYLKLAIELLEESDWEVHYEKVLDIYNEAAETGMIAGEFEKAEVFLQKSLKNARNFSDRLKAHELKITHLSEAHQFPETVNYLLQVLDEIGYGIKRNPGKLTILKEFILVKLQFIGKSTDDILNLPTNENERAKAFIKLTVMASVALFGCAPDILPIINFRQTRLSLKYGNSEYSPFSYSAYGFAISAFMGDISNGYDLAKMSLKLLDKNNSDIIKAKVMVVFYGFLSYWKDSIMESLAPLQEAYYIGRQTGDLLYASFGISFYNQIRIFTGHNLFELLDSMTTANITIKNLNQDLVYIISECQRQYVIGLVSHVEEPWILQNDGFNEEMYLEKLDKLNDEASKFDVYFYKLALACQFNEYEIGYVNAELAGKYEEETTSRQIPYPTFLFFSAMAVLKSKEQNPTGLSSKNRKTAKKKINRLKDFAKHAPQNFENKHVLLEAFLLETSGNPIEPYQKYQQAVSLSIKSNFIHEEAISREHFAYFLIKIGQKEYGELMIQKAYDCFQKWGADNKCRQLKSKFPDIFGKSTLEKSDSSISAIQNIYDLNTIIKSNRILSSENSLDGLLMKMVELVIANASCTKAVIALKDNNTELVSYAIGTNEEINIYPEGEAHPVFEYPQSVVHFVSHSKIEFVSPNLKADNRYKFDEYVKAKLPVSVCCIPIIAKDEFLGVIYFENNLAESAFDKKRVEFFKTIAAQLAISLDNVMLYSQMEQKVKSRTSELMIKNEELTNEKRKSDNLLLNILPAETAEELKNFGKTTAKRYDKATILFCDIENFTSISEKLTAEELVSELDVCFQKFDEISSANGLEKIKTIGDAYMAVGGVPDSNKATAEDVVRCSLMMQDFIKEHAEQRVIEGKLPFEMRVGINTGAVVSGVVGTKKFQFDIWGEAVNIAARMEQHGEPGKVNISKSTYELIKNKFECYSRGKVDAKNMGDTDMYFVEQEKGYFTLERPQTKSAL